MFDKNNILRLIADILLILMIFILPSYISIILIFIAIILFNNFFESIIFAYFLDILYSNGVIFGYHFAYMFTLISLIFYIFSFSLKKVVRL